MKKKTNKILWITIAAFTVIAMVVVTVDFQVSYHKHPEKFIRWQPAETDQSDTITIDEDSTENVTSDSSIN